MDRRHVLAGLAGLVLPARGLAQTSEQNSTSRQSVALSVGISDYESGPRLPSARGDAALVAATLLGLGIRTELLLDATQDEVLIALARLRLRAANTKTVLVYVAAHGLMEQGVSHFFAGDAPFTGPEPLAGSISESTVIKAVSDQPRQKILFLDTCRELPPGTNVSWGSRGAIGHAHYAGVHVSYAAQPGAPAMDGEDGHSPFALSLSHALEIPGLDLQDIARIVRLSVLRQTSGLQVPWERSSLLAKVVLNPSTHPIDGPQKKTTKKIVP